VNFTLLSTVEMTDEMISILGLELHSKGLPRPMGKFFCQLFDPGCHCSSATKFSTTRHGLL